MRTARRPRQSTRAEQSRAAADGQARWGNSHVYEWLRLQETPLVGLITVTFECRIVSSFRSSQEKRLSQTFKPGRETSVCQWALHHRISHCLHTHAVTLIQSLLLMLSRCSLRWLRSRSTCRTYHSCTLGMHTSVGGGSKLFTLFGKRTGLYYHFIYAV